VTKMGATGVAFVPFVKAVVEARFKKLLEATVFTEADKAAYQGHVNSIASRIRRSFKTTSIEVFGSVSRGTAIRQQSDIDLLVVMEPAEVLWAGQAISSTTLLSRLRNELLDRFPNTSLGRDGEAVVVPFADGRYPIDVVPGFLAKGDGTIETYGIPSIDGRWKATAPGAHKGFIMRENFATGGRLSQAARLVKFWRCCRIPDVPVSSFHVELLLAGEKICGSKHSIAEAFYLTLKVLADRGCRGLRDPVGIGGLIPACSTDAKRDAAMRSVNYALDHSEAALRAMYAGERNEALRQWDIVFNGWFPKS
jgi:predicted nucleotidyltransferase